MPRDKKKGDDAPPGAPAWMVTYGDMMSLLLTFFVLLISFSTISEEDFNEAMMSLQGALGVLDSNTSPVRIFHIPEPPKSLPKSVERLARELKKRLQVLGKDEEIDIQLDKEGGLKLNLPSRILFDTARAELKPDAYEVLNNMAEVLSGVPGAFIEVRGHTDNRPLRSRGPFKDNHDLSYGRAKAVWEYLLRAGTNVGDQFEIIACGAEQPVATNDTEEGRQANRRVELYVRGELSEDIVERLRTGAEPAVPAITVEPPQ